MTATTETRKHVTRIEDDSPCPLTGLVLGHEDEDRVWVAWGDAQWSDDPWADARVEYADELTVRRQAVSS